MAKTVYDVLIAKHEEDVALFNTVSGRGWG
jgi:hypothetical protein